MTLVVFSCNYIKENDITGEQSIDSDIELFGKNLQNEFSALNNTLKANNLKLGNLKDMEVLLGLKDDKFRQGYNFGFDLFSNQTENFRKMENDHGLVEAQKEFINQVIIQSEIIKDSGEYLNFLSEKLLLIENLKITTGQKSYLKLFMVNQIEIIKFLKDYFALNSTNSGRVLGCELSSSDALGIGIGIWGGAIGGGLFGAVVGGGILSVPAGVAGFVAGAIGGGIGAGVTLAVQKAIECVK
jgi:hypothetical protein